MPFIIELHACGTSLYSRSGAARGLRITEVLYNCPRCGGLLEAVYGKPAQSAVELKALWRARRCSNAPLDQSGVWRYREFIPFLDDLRARGDPAGRLHAAAAGPPGRGVRRPGRAGLQAPGLQPHRVVQGQRDDLRRVAGACDWAMTRVACVSTGNTSASMAAYASAAGLQPVIFIPARQHLVRQTRAGAGIRRQDHPGGGEFRPDSGAGAATGGPARDLPAQLDQSRSASRARRPSWRRCWTSAIGACPTGWCCRAGIWATSRHSAKACANSRSSA